MKNKELSLGERIRNQRIEMEYSLRELAPLVDCSAVNLSRIENGKRLPSLKVVHALAKHLKIDVDELTNRLAILKLSGMQNHTQSDLSDAVRFYQGKIGAK